MLAAMYWEEPDRSGHRFGPENDTVMAAVLKEVQTRLGETTPQRSSLGPEKLISPKIGGQQHRPADV